MESIQWPRMKKAKNTALIVVKIIREDGTMNKTIQSLEGKKIKLSVKKGIAIIETDIDPFNTICFLEYMRDMLYTKVSDDLKKRIQEEGAWFKKPE
jgi:hypothetical protein